MPDFKWLLFAKAKTLDEALRNIQKVIEICLAEKKTENCIMNIARELSFHLGAV